MRVVLPEGLGWGALPPLVGPFPPHGEPDLIAAASATVRGFAGWHIAPIIAETLTVHVGAGLLGAIVLPTGKLRTVSAVRVNGHEVSDWAMGTDGTVYLPGVTAGPAVVEVDATHGYGLDEVADVLQVVQQMAALAASSPAGVVSEQAGSLSVTYGQTGKGVGGGLALLPRDRDLLGPYVIAVGP